MFSKYRYKTCLPDDFQNVAVSFRVPVQANIGVDKPLAATNDWISTNAHTPLHEYCAPMPTFHNQNHADWHYRVDA